MVCLHCVQPLAHVALCIGQNMAGLSDALVMHVRQERKNGSKGRRKT